MKLWMGSNIASRKPYLRQRTYAAALAGWFAMAAIAIAAAPSIGNARVHASILVDVQTGRVLEAHNADRRCYPASLAKLMTLYITFQQLSTGKLTLGKELPVSRHAAAQAPTKLYLRPGERISVRSAILAITTRSANDVAVVLAEAEAGSEWNFAQLMNREALKLGMNRTTFRNASGLPNRHQRTTARDMSKLAMAILRNYPQYYHFFKARSFDFRGRTIYGHDHLLGHYPGVDGLKTGYTSASGFNIVTSAVRYNHRLLGVVMGGRSARSRDRLMIALLNRGFANLRRSTLTAAERNEPTTYSVARFKQISAEDQQEDEAARPDSGWMVQIGGNFRNSYQVRRALRSALHTAPEQLREARALVVRLRGHRYRARFSEMTESSALDACRALRTRKFTCNAFQIRKSGIAMASARP